MMCEQWSVAAIRSNLLRIVTIVFFMAAGSWILGDHTALAQTASTNTPIMFRNITPSERATVGGSNSRVVLGGRAEVFNGSGTRAINGGFTNPRTGGEQTTSVYYAGRARPNIPACASNIQVRLGGNFAMRFRSHNGVGTWGAHHNPVNDHGRDYPEATFMLLNSGEFGRFSDLVTSEYFVYGETYIDLVDSTYNLSWLPSADDLYRQGRVMSITSPPGEWRSVNAAQAEEFTLLISAEIMDYVSNRGRQWSYNVTGNPELQVRWNNADCLRNRPYLHINGGDVYSGASFSDAACTPTTRAGNSPIVTNGFSEEGTAGTAGAWRGGTSQSQYAVFASGIVGGSAVPSTNTFLGNYGYLSRPPGPFTSMNPLRDVLFANHGNDRGSYYAATPTAMPCIGGRELDEIDARIAADDPSVFEANNTNDVLDFIGDDRSGVMVANGDINTVSGRVLTDEEGTVRPGVHKTIVINNGNLLLRGNVSYPATYSTLADVPFLQIITRGGNIYLDHHNTRHVDAHLMAVPRITGEGNSQVQTHGIIDTCASGSNGGTWPTRMRADTCYKQPTPGITINGSMAARRILWKNTSGTLGRSGEYITDIPGLISDICSAGVSAGGASARSPSRYDMCAAELVNFHPETHLRHYRDNTPNIYSNVPLLTRELPPIF